MILMASVYLSDETLLVKTIPSQTNCGRPQTSSECYRHGRILFIQEKHAENVELSLYRLGTYIFTCLYVAVCVCCSAPSIQYVSMCLCIMLFVHKHTVSFFKCSHLNSQSRGAQMSSWTARLRPDRRSGLRRRTAGCPAAAARPGIRRSTSAACRHNERRQRTRSTAGVSFTADSSAADTDVDLQKLYQCLRLMMVRKRTVRVMRMVRAAAAEMMLYRRRLTCCRCTRTTVWSLAGPGPAAPNAEHPSKHDHDDSAPSVTVTPT